MSLAINFLYMKEENMNQWEVESLDCEGRQAELIAALTLTSVTLGGYSNLSKLRYLI